jgi:integrase
MPKVKLTQRVVDGITPAAKDVIVWDAEIPCFGLRVQPSGVRSYIVQYRTAHGRSRRLTIAKHGKVTLEQARKEARDIFAAVRFGHDPVAERRARIAAPTVGELLDRYLAEHVEKRNGPRNRVEMRRLVEGCIRPRLGGHKVAAVTRQDIAALHYELSATPRRANIVLAVCSKVFNLAELWEMRADGANPCKRIERYKENARERFLSDAELGRLGEVMRARVTDAAATANVRMTMTAIELLLYTGCRLSEVLNLRWFDVDLEADTLTLAQTKSGRPRRVILGDEARRIFGELHDRHRGERATAVRIDRHREDAWVLPSADVQRPLSVNAIEKAWHKVRTTAGLDDVRLHDLRHTFGTYASQAGANAYVVRDALGHSTLAMTGRYVNRADAPLRAVTNLVGERIAAGLAGEPRGEVVPLRREG